MGRRLHPALLFALAGALLLGAFALRAGAFSSDIHDADRRSELAGAARSLLPFSWREVASQEGQCVPLAAYPSCLTVLFDRGEQARPASAAEVRAAARTAGWRPTGDDVARSLTILHFRRRELSAFVALRESARSTCGHRTFFDCASYVDDLQVTYS
jgi:hypothetical protein